MIEKLDLCQCPPVLPASFEDELSLPEIIAKICYKIEEQDKKYATIEATLDTHTQQITDLIEAVTDCQADYTTIKADIISLQNEINELRSYATVKMHVCEIRTRVNSGTSYNGLDYNGLVLRNTFYNNSSNALSFDEIYYTSTAFPSPPITSLSWFGQINIIVGGSYKLHMVIAQRRTAASSGYRLQLFCVNTANNEIRLITLSPEDLIMTDIVR